MDGWKLSVEAIRRVSESTPGTLVYVLHASSELESTIRTVWWDAYKRPQMLARKPLFISDEELAELVKAGLAHDSWIQACVGQRSRTFMLFWRQSYCQRLVDVTGHYAFDLMDHVLGFHAPHEILVIHGLALRDEKHGGVCTTNALLDHFQLDDSLARSLETKNVSVNQFFRVRVVCNPSRADAEALIKETVLGCTANKLEIAVLGNVCDHDSWQLADGNVRFGALVGLLRDTPPPPGAKCTAIDLHVGFQRGCSARLVEALSENPIPWKGRFQGGVSVLPIRDSVLHDDTVDHLEPLRKKDYVMLQNRFARLLEESTSCWFNASYESYASRMVDVKASAGPVPILYLDTTHPCVTSFSQSCHVMQWNAFSLVVNGGESELPCFYPLVSRSDAVSCCVLTHREFLYPSGFLALTAGKALEVKKFKVQRQPKIERIRFYESAASGRRADADCRFLDLVRNSMDAGYDIVDVDGLMFTREFSATEYVTVKTFRCTAGADDDDSGAMKGPLAGGLQESSAEGAPSLSPGVIVVVDVQTAKKHLTVVFSALCNQQRVSTEWPNAVVYWLDGTSLPGSGDATSSPSSLPASPSSLPASPTPSPSPSVSSSAIMPGSPRMKDMRSPPTSPKSPLRKTTLLARSSPSSANKGIRTRIWGKRAVY
eukprot:ANDGO_05799.mRNA.1 hypothetical protein